MPTYSRWYDAPTGNWTSQQTFSNGREQTARVYQSFEERQNGIRPVYSSAHRVCATSKAFNGIGGSYGGGIANGVSDVGCIGGTFVPDSQRTSGAGWGASASNPASSLIGDSYSATMFFGRHRCRLLPSMSLTDFNRQVPFFDYPDAPAGSYRELESGNVTLMIETMRIDMIRADPAGSGFGGGINWGFISPSSLNSGSMAAYTPHLIIGPAAVGTGAVVPAAYLTDLNRYFYVGIIHEYAFSAFDPGDLGASNPGSASVLYGVNVGFRISADYARPRYRFVTPDPPPPPPVKLRGWRLGSL